MTKNNVFYTWRSSISDSDLPSTARHVALAMSLYLNERTTTAYPGQARLARDTGLTERCVREHLGVLVKAGFLAIKEQGGLKGEKRHATVYEIRTPEPVLPMQEDHPSSSRRAPRNLTTLTPEPGADQLSKELSKELSIPAREVVKAFWERSDPKPATPFVALLKNAEKLMEAGWTPEEVAAALPRARAFTMNALEYVLREPMTAGPQSVGDRNLVRLFGENR